MAVPWREVRPEPIQCARGLLWVAARYPAPDDFPAHWSVSPSSVVPELPVIVTLLWRLQADARPPRAQDRDPLPHPVAISAIGRIPEISFNTLVAPGSKEHGDVDDHLRAWVVDDRMAVQHASAICRRQYDQLPFHDDGEWLQFLLPARRELTGASVFLLQARRESPVSRGVMLPDNRDVARSEDDVEFCTRMTSVGVNGLMLRMFLALLVRFKRR